MTLKKEPRDANGSTPLHLSSEKGFLDVVTYFIDSGVEKEPRDADEDTPLHKAACNGRIDVVKYFLQLEGVQYFHRFIVKLAESLLTCVSAKSIFYLIFEFCAVSTCTCHLTY